MMLSGSTARNEGDATMQGAAVDWERTGRDLDAFGYATLNRLIDAETCADLIESYHDDAQFRSHVVMRRHGFGEGEYKYFSHPLPSPIERLRQTIYPKLAPIANRWMAAMGAPHRYPDRLEPFLDRCHAAGQTRPTPLLLKYRAGDYNCLHQDLYGEQVFPIQLAILLSDPCTDFAGGEFVLTEQRPRMQSRAEVVPLSRGDGVLFAVNERPKRGTSGTYRVRMRHGVSRIRQGQRYATGIIFHDAA